MKNSLAAILALAEKDIRVEVRNKEAFLSSLLFIALTLVILGAGSMMSAEFASRLFPGAIWIVVTFSGTIVFSHLCARDHENRFQEGLLLTGVSGTTLFLSKFITALLFLNILEAAAVLLTLLFFNLSIDPPYIGNFVMVMALATIGYAAIGTLFASLLSQVRLRGIFLPVVLYPAILPLLITAIRATSNALAGESGNEVLFLLGVDIIFVTAGALLFDFLAESPL